MAEQDAPVFRNEQKQTKLPNPATDLPIYLVALVFDHFLDPINEVHGFIIAEVAHVARS